MLIDILLSLLPVLIFLLGLVLLDSYKLIKPVSIILTVLVGCLIAVLCYFCNRWLVDIFTVYKYFGASVLEEMAKATFIIYLIKSNKVGFIVDAAIYGFAIGSGFALIENIYYLQIIGSSNIFIWVIRGFGTAVMHGSTTAIFAIISKAIVDRKSNDNLLYYVPGFLLATLIHSAFNQFISQPIVATILQLLVLPIVVVLVYDRSERSLKSWMELGFETNINLIKFIHSDEISKTKIGKYLYSLKNKFPSTVVSDILCFLKIYNELAFRAKGVLMMREAGFNSPISTDINEKFNELKYLEKSIGPTGKLALSTILKINKQDLWQLYFLNKK